MSGLFNRSGSNIKFVKVVYSIYIYRILQFNHFQVYETAEFFTIILKYVTAGGVLGSAVTAKITIIDNDGL